MARKRISAQGPVDLGRIPTPQKVHRRDTQDDPRNGSIPQAGIRLEGGGHEEPRKDRKRIGKGGVRYGKEMETAEMG